MMPQNLLPDSPPRRSPEPVLHLSAGRYLFAQRYVIGWPEHGLVKIGCGNERRVKRFLHTSGAHALDIAYYERLYDDVRAESWLHMAALRLWPAAWQFKHEARFLMGNNTGGWTEFCRIPVEDWPILRRMAAI
jgi:hypothetical protein